MQFRNILVPFDFSPSSDAALGHAATWARHWGAHITLLNVVPALPRQPGENPATDNATVLDLVTRDLAEIAGARLDGIGAEITVVEGDRVDTILNTATHDFDLVVMGTHGRSGIQTLWLGSVAERVVRAAPCPVITHSAAGDPSLQPIAAFERILCPIKFSDTSGSAVDFAVALAKDTGASLTLLHVVEYYRDAAPTALLNIGELETYISSGAQQELERWLPAGARATCRLTTRVRVGKAYEEILGVASEERSQLIVLGAPPSGASPFFGSTAQRVLRQASCPVLTLGRPRAR